MDRNDSQAALDDLTEAAQRWDRAAEICEQRKDLEGARTFRAHADTADTCHWYLQKYAGTDQEVAVRRKIHAKIAVCASAERRMLLREDALQFRGTVRGLVAAMKLAGWSKEDGDKAYAELRKDRRIQDQLKGASARSVAGPPTDLRVARAARIRDRQSPGRLPTARAGATDPDLASFLRG